METVRRMENSIIQMIIKDYNEFFLSNSEISKKYNIHRMNVQKILKDNNVNLRKRTPGIKVDHIFFESYNPYSCYWAGFILADGYVRTEKRNLLSIKLSIKDLSHLEKFKEAIKSEGSIEVNKDFCRISISSKKIIDDLREKFSIVSKKTFIAFIDNKIPKEYLSHFIRGYLDGDGTLTVSTCETLGFLGTLETLDSIRNFFYDSGIKLRTKEKPSISKNKNIFSVSYYGKSAISCCEILYKGSEEKIRLDRKFNIFQKWKIK
jgi:hypothetical protein